MKLQWFCEIRHPNGQTVFLLFQAGMDEGYREILRRAQLEAERIGVELLGLFDLDVWAIAEVPPLELSQPQTH
ncbi:MAG: hypothetical protein WB586_12285 [Chthoniobacterales bacterium]